MCCARDGRQGAVATRRKRPRIATGAHLLFRRRRKLDVTTTALSDFPLPTRTRHTPPPEQLPATLTPRALSKRFMENSTQHGKIVRLAHNWELSLSFFAARRHLRVWARRHKHPHTRRHPSSHKNRSHLLLLHLLGRRDRKTAARFRHCDRRADGVHILLHNRFEVPACVERERERRRETRREEQRW